MILIISATNRTGSNSLKVANFYLNTLKKNKNDVELFSLENLPANLILTDMYGKRSPEFELIQQKVMEADKFIFVVPEYNGSFPGVLKTFIDCCKFPQSFLDKKAALVGLSSGKYGNIRGIEHLTGICNYIGIHVLPTRLHIPNISSELDENQNLFKTDTVGFVEDQLKRFLVF